MDGNPQIDLNLPSEDKFPLRLFLIFLTDFPPLWLGWIDLLIVVMYNGGYHCYISG